MKKILIILSVFIFTTNAYSNSKFDKDLKKISKDSAFVDNKGKVYSKEQITDKQNTILYMFHISPITPLRGSLLPPLRGPLG